MRHTHFRGYQYIDGYWWSEIGNTNIVVLSVYFCDRIYTRRGYPWLLYIHKTYATKIILKAGIQNCSAATSCFHFYFLIFVKLLI